MRNFIYRCPVKNLNVQGSIEEREAEGKALVPQNCLACGLLHMVSPVTDKSISEKLRDRR